METDVPCDVQASRPDAMAPKMTPLPAPVVIGFRANADRGARLWENRQIRIHGADLGARSAIQSGSDHARSTSKPNKGIGWSRMMIVT